MSAAGRGTARQKDDFYETPAWCVHRLLEACKLPGGKWFEPACGNGAIIRAATNMCHDVEWYALDIDPKATAEQMLVRTGIVRCDFLGHSFAKMRPAVILTNPPYSLAFNFAQKAVTEAEHVVFLLRLNWLASKKRNAWLQAHTPDVYVLPNRPSFVDRISCVDDFQKECAWHTTAPKRVEGQLICRACGSLTRRHAATDSIEYAWLHWGPSTSGKLLILNTTPADERK